MNNIIAPALVSETEVRDRLQRPVGPLLLNFTAGWCQPCKTFAPVLGALQRMNGGKIEIMRVDVDAWPDLARKFQVRGIPATILVREGVEYDRFVGTKPESGVVRWLAERGVALAAAADDTQAQPFHGAFYGDDGLKQFLVERLFRHMNNGEVRASTIPSWIDGKGSISCALVHHTSPGVFERVTGLPYGFAYALELFFPEHRNEIEDVFTALTPGQDVRQVPFRLMRGVLGAEAIGWTKVLDSDPHETLRQRWLGLSGELADGANVPIARWIELSGMARAITTPDRDPYHQLEDHFASLVERLSPPPDAWDVGAWQGVYRDARSVLALLVYHHEGWTRNDVAKPLLRHRFFEKHLPLDVDGRFDERLFEAKRAEWEGDNVEFSAREKDFLGSGRFSETLAALNARLRPMLADILRSN
ncbi:thioredoxin family protein [Duganella hordei]|uniref:thioredoxin family protein n=1 Tax=Duganella hordei TaxID=2865934 RepID=UPI0030EAF9CE